MWCKLLTRTMLERSKVFGAAWTWNFATRGCAARKPGEFTTSNARYCPGLGSRGASLWQHLPTVRSHGNRKSRRWHPAHSELHALAGGSHPERYEELRAVYNLVRPEGSRAAPPYEEWTGISDVCDHPEVFCRYCCDTRSTATAYLEGTTLTRCTFAPQASCCCERTRALRYFFAPHTVPATVSMMRASSCHEAIFSPRSGHDTMISCWSCIFACGSQIRLAAYPESLAHPWENTSSAVTGTERGGALLFASPRCHVSLHDVLMPRRVVTDIRFSRKFNSPPFCSASLRQGNGFARELVSRTCCTGREG